MRYTRGDGRGCRDALTPLEARADHPEAHHVVATIGLIVSGLQALQRGAAGFDLALAIVEIVTSLFLIGSLARAIGHTRANTSATDAHHHHGVDWVDMWAAGVLFAEAGERWHLHHHVARPIILTGLVTLGLALMHGRMSAFRQRRRSMRVTDAGIYVPGKPFRSFRARWGEIAAVNVGDRSADIRTREGHVRRLDLLDLENAAEVKAALKDAQRRVQAAAPTTSC